MDYQTQDKNSQEQQTANESQTNQGPKDEGVSGQDLLDELGRLGEKFVEVAGAAWKSDQRKQVESDIKQGISSLANNLEDCFKRFDKREQTQDFVNRAEDAAESLHEKVRGSKMAHDLASGLMQGLQKLGEKLDDLVDEFQSSSKSTTAERDQEQDIPIDKG